MGHLYFIVHWTYLILSLVSLSCAPVVMKDRSIVIFIDKPWLSVLLLIDIFLLTLCVSGSSLAATGQTSNKQYTENHQYQHSTTSNNTYGTVVRRYINLAKSSAEIAGSCCIIRHCRSQVHCKKWLYLCTAMASYCCGRLLPTTILVRASDLCLYSMYSWKWCCM